MTEPEAFERASQAVAARCEELAREPDRPKVLTREELDEAVADAGFEVGPSRVVVTYIPARNPDPYPWDSDT